MIEFFKKFMPYIKGHYFSFGIAILAGLLTAGCTALVTYLVKPMLDQIFIDKNSQMLMILPFLLVLAYAGKSIGAFIQTYFMGFIGEDIVRQIRDKMLRNMLLLDLGFFNKNRTGELMARITSDIARIRDSVSNYVTEFFREGLTAIGLICVVLYQSPKLALIGLVIIPAAIYPILLIIKKLKVISRLSQEKNSDITSRLSEIFNNIEIIKASNGEKIESQIFEKENKEFLRLNMKNLKMSNLQTPIMETLGAFAVGGVIFIGGKSVIDGSMSVGSFFSFVTALFMAYTPIKRIVSNYAKMQDAIVASNRIHEIMDREPTIKDGEKEFCGDINSINFRDVYLKYDDEYVLKDININFHKDEIVALVGKSGSGKSSLVNLILRLYDCTKGEIRINDEPLKNFTQKSIRDNISIVTQRIFIFNDTIASNVAYGSEIDEARVIDALRKAMILDFVEGLPNGIYTKLDEFGTNLSGGQKQRISIARAIYKDPKVLILDEATSALDAKTEELFKETIKTISGGKIVIMIAHRPSTIELANRVFHIEDGVLLENIHN